MIAFARDITIQLAMEEELDARAKKLERVQNVLSESTFYSTVDLTGKFSFISKALLAFVGYRREELIGKNYTIFKHSDNDPKMYASIWQAIGNDSQEWRGEVKSSKKNGEIFWLDLVVCPLFDEQEEKIGYYAYGENITDKKEILYLSEHDSLTGTYNRRKADELLSHCYSEHRRYGTPASIILMDIDHFKKINDSYGHQVGDTVLVTLTEKVKENLREVDYLIRWGGEEFLVVLPYTDIIDARSVAEKIRAKVEEHFFDCVGKITCSFGVSLIRKEQTVDESIAEADSKLYNSKQNGRNRVT